MLYFEAFNYGKQSDLFNKLILIEGRISTTSTHVLKQNNANRDVVLGLPLHDVCSTPLIDTTEYLKKNYP